MKTLPPIHTTSRRLPLLGSLRYILFRIYLNPLTWAVLALWIMFIFLAIYNNTCRSGLKDWVQISRGSTGNSTQHSIPVHQTGWIIFPVLISICLFLRGWFDRRPHRWKILWTLAPIVMVSFILFAGFILLGNYLGMFSIPWLIR